MKYEFVCEDCEANYDIVHSEDMTPTYCPFCGWNVLFDNEEDEDEEWDDQDRERF